MVIERVGDAGSTDHLSVVFAALADPTRRAILARLADGERTVTELTRPFALSQPAVSKHLKVLERAGLVSRSRRATARLSRLEATPLKEASDWLARYRAYWEESYARLDTLLQELQAPPEDVTATTGRPDPPIPPATGPRSGRRHRTERSAS